MNVQDLNKELGNIDLYLLDQVLKNRIPLDSKILDAGSGEGRNLIYFLNNGYQVYGVDKNTDAIRLLKFIIGSTFPDYSKSKFSEEELQRLNFESHFFDYIICSAVLHFAKSHGDFWLMIERMHYVLRPGGTLFIRMTSNIGLSRHQPQGGGTFLLPDGSVRYLLTEKMIIDMKTKYGYANVEPTKSVVVGNQRTMTTLVLKKNE